MTEPWNARLPVTPSPALLKVAAVVAEHTDKRRRRGPNWKFKVGPDLVVSIQPFLARKYTRTGRWGRTVEVDDPLEFVGRATEGEGDDQRYIEFLIDKDWVLRVRQMGPFRSLYGSTATWRPEYPRPLSHEQVAEYLREKDAADGERQVPFEALRERVLAVFRDGYFERVRPGDLLGDHCICCNKPLTDPISMARCIGPECYGSSSADIPWLVDLQAA